MTRPDGGRPDGGRLGDSALGVGAFRRLWVAGLVSDSGDWLLFIALPLVVLKLSGSALGTSIAFLLELVPAVVLAPLVARVVDRFDRRTVLLVVTIGQGLSLVPLLFVHTRGDLPLVYGVIVAQAVFSAAFEPAKSALLPTLVDPSRIVSANALVGLNQSLGRLIGGPVGGVLLAVGGLDAVVVADVVSFAAAAVLVAGLPRGGRSPGVAGRASSGPASATAVQTRRGLVHALQSPRMRGPLVVFAVASVPQGLFVVLFVFFVTGPLGGSDADVGLLRGVQAVGAIVAGIALGFIAARVDVRRMTVIGVAAFALVSLAIWNLPFVSHALWIYVALFIVIGAPGVFLDAGLSSIVQLLTDDDDRGSVFTAIGLVQAIGQAIGMVVAGLFTARAGVLPLLELQGGLYVAAAVLAVVLLPRVVRPVAVGASVAAAS